MVPQEGQNRDHSIRVDHHLQLVVAGHLRTAGSEGSRALVSAPPMGDPHGMIHFNVHKAPRGEADGTDLHLLDIFWHHFRHVLAKSCQLVLSYGVFGPDGGCGEMADRG